MKKLKLNLDDLRVESFDVTPETGKEQGTVAGYGHTWKCELTHNGTCDPSENPGLTCWGETCWPSCGEPTCFNTCGGEGGNDCTQHWTCGIGC